MFPYPSGNLHMGHVRVYSISDTLARFHRMNGKNVLHPMGWDAFGLPAENAAIERGLSSELWTAKNIQTMREQLKQLGCTFDWSREITTCHKEYYKFTQMIFLKLYEKGLVYQKKALVNWDPVDKTVLANEQVTEDGYSWRSGAKVEKKVLKQWFIRTSSFAKALYDGLDRKDLEDWKDIIDLQKHWIGKCDGISFEFPIKDRQEEVTLWTEKPEHLTKAKFVAFNHGSVMDIENEGSGNRKLDIEIVNTVTGDLLPVFITDQLPFFEGADGRVGIPSEFECDFDFARKVGIISPLAKFEPEEKRIFSDRKHVLERIKGRATSSKIKDWLISRQRHWGTPIPMVHCEKCGVQPVSHEQLPVVLPQMEKVSERGSRMVCSQDWLSTSCSKCGGAATRDVDTMDTFVDSSWYYLRYTDPHNDKEPFSIDTASPLMPVDIYIGGKEHAVLHLYYARFMSYFFHSLGWLRDPEPFKRLVVQGMVMGKTYRVKGSGKFIPAADVEVKEKTVTERSSGKPVVESWEKMSKSKYNGVEPGEMIEKYGVDTTRLLINGAVAPTSQRNWDEATFAGVLNWQRRMWMTVAEMRKAATLRQTIAPPTDLAQVEELLRDSRNYYLRSITTAYNTTHQLNKVVSSLQGLTGDMRKYRQEYQCHSWQYLRALATQVVLMSPIAPCFAAQLWEGLCGLPALQDCDEFDVGSPAHLQAWPQIDSDYELNLVCMVNGAVKDTLKIRKDQLDHLTVVSASQLALNSCEVKKYTDMSPVLDAHLKLYPGVHAMLDLQVDPTKIKRSKEPKEKKPKKRKTFTGA
ncbi:probable leucine--tRNA ligase, mitochondrial isoform X2 [Macrosteles quadrilineatus]|nr:probable leucine--tRNA ligase, mitochondrial isoform X2 [Macrosteles quadrilineatus]